MEIPCQFQAVPRWYDLFEDGSDVTKFGYYDSTNLPALGLGSTVWALVANIITDEPLSTYVDAGHTHQEIVEACVRYLNKPPTKRARKPRFGKLRLRYCNVLPDGRISASLLTTDRKNKHFWGRGSKSTSHRSTSVTKPSRSNKRKK